MRQRMSSNLLVCAALLALHATTAGAQTGTLLEEKQISRAAVIESLMPEPLAADEARTRSIRISRDRTPGHFPVKPAQPVKPASAGLLITFQTNSSELTEQAMHALDVVSDALNSDQLQDFRFNVEGHADPRGGSEFNMDLSRHRAEAVRAYLIGRNVEERRLVAIGRGDQEVLYPARPDAPENRRVTIVNLSQ